MDANEDKEPENPKTYLAKVVHWSSAGRPDWVEISASAIGMAGPILLGVAAGNLELGAAMAVGSLLIGGVGAKSDARSQIRAMAEAIVPAVFAAVAAVSVAGHGWLSDAAVTVLAGIAATLVAVGRPIATLAMRFILLLLITMAVADSMAMNARMLLPMAGGLVWTALVSLLLGAVARVKHGDIAAPEAATPPLRQRLTRWRRALTALAGWQYPLRLMLCLAVAGLLRWLWPDHHMQWVALTVALLTEYPIEAFPVKTTQRALGAALGVLAAGILVFVTPPGWAMVIAIGILAGLRPFLRAGNYLAYSAAMTPLVILLIDAGHQPGAGVLIDRLVATLIGAALVIAANALLKTWIGAAAARGAP